MRQSVFVAALLATLSACSKPNEGADQKGAPPPPASQASDSTAAAESDSSPVDAKTAAFTNAVKVDFASQFVAGASEACAGIKGQQPPDFQSGSPMQYSASGVISWGKGSLDYVKEPGATVALTSNRGDKTFAFVADIYDLPKGDRKYVAGLSQLHGGSLNATVTDATKAVDGDASLNTGNLCIGNVVPALVTQGMWPLAAKYLIVPPTTMTCMEPGKFESQSLSFAFDGKTIQAGTQTFTQADSATGETLGIDPKGSTAGVVYSIAKADGTGVGLGLSQANMLTYASVDLAGGGRLICARK